MEGLKGESQEKSVSFVQGGYAFNRSLLSYSITHQMPGSLWKKELLKTPVSVFAGIPPGCPHTSSCVSSALRVCAVDGCHCCGSVCHGAKGLSCAIKNVGTEPCHLTI